MLASDLYTVDYGTWIYVFRACRYMYLCTHFDAVVAAKLYCMLILYIILSVPCNGSFPVTDRFM